MTVCLQQNSATSSRSPVSGILDKSARIKTIFFRFECVTHVNVCYVVFWGLCTQFMSNPIFNPIKNILHMYMQLLFVFFFISKQNHSGSKFCQTTWKTRKMFQQPWNSRAPNTLKRTVQTVEALSSMLEVPLWLYRLWKICGHRYLLLVTSRYLPLLGTVDLHFNEGQNVLTLATSSCFSGPTWRNIFSRVSTVEVFWSERSIWPHWKGVGFLPHVQTISTGSQIPNWDHFPFSLSSSFLWETPPLRDTPVTLQKREQVSVPCTCDPIY